jgi:SAM-dependent methyltransferase
MQHPAGQVNPALSALDPTRRFTDRVDDYLRHRPRYPAATLDFLRAELGLRPPHVIADIGSGTGFLAEVFLDAGHRVYGVEPNDEMRLAGERHLARYPNFTSVAARSEATTLPAATADFVTAGQAFHWFDPAPTKREFLRILKPGGWVVLARNELKCDGDAFLEKYRALARRSRHDRALAEHPAVSAFHDPVLAEFFSPAPFRKSIATVHAHDLDYDQALGRLQSFSSIPLPGDPSHAAMAAELRRLFDQHQRGGRVRFPYDVELVYGQPGVTPSVV